MKKYFYLDESPIYENRFLIRLNFENFQFPHGTTGSFNVFIARVLNLHYVDYLRYARDKLGAELFGKNTRYVVPYFPKTPEVDLFLKVLNKRMEYIDNERNYPFNYEEDSEGKVVRIPFVRDENNNRTVGEA